MKTFKRKRLIVGIVSALAIAASGSALAEQDVTVSVDIPAQTASNALIALSELTKTEIILSRDLNADLQLPALKGSYTLTTALEKMLTGSGLTYSITQDGVVMIKATEKSVRKEGGKEKDEDIEEIVVTGSHIKRNPGELDRQVTVYSRQDIDATGATTLDEFMRDIPQNFNAPTENGSGFTGSFGSTRNYFGASGVNLRGIGEKATLILIDGKRTARGGVLGEATDISTIPLSMVERVEIIFDGASSLYGADAVGGVVNIITRKNYEGVEVGVTHVAPELGGTAETTFRLGGTYSWDTGSLTSSYQYMRRSTLTGDERELRFNSGNGPLPSGSPANVLAVDQPMYDENDQYIGFGRLPLYYLDASGNAVDASNPNALTPVYTTQLPESETGTGILASDFTGRAVTEGERAESGRSLIPSRDDHGLQLRFRQELPGELLLSGSLGYGVGTTSSFESNQVFQVYVYPYTVYPGGYSYGNINSPFPGTVQLVMDTPYLPDTLRETDKKNINASLTLDGSFSEDWDWSASLSSSESSNKSVRTNVVNPQTSNYLGGNSQFVPDWADWALNANIFATPYMGFASAQEVIDFIIIPKEFTENINENTDIEFTTNGKLLSLPGGDAHALFGLGIREEEGRLYDTTATVDSWQSPTRNSELNNLGTTYDEETRRRNDYLKAEVNIPVFGDEFTLPGVKRLEFTFSGHYDEYTSYGSKFDEDTDQMSNLTIKDSGSSWSMGLVWQPLEWLRVRANKSTSFSMPSLASYALPANLSLGSQSLWTLDGTMTGERIQMLFLDGGNPELSPENSVTTAIGFTITPTSLPDFVARVNFHSNQYTNKVGQLGRITNLAWEDLWDYENNDAISYDPQRDLYTIDRRMYNTGLSDTKGFDVELNYSMDTDWGLFDMRLDYGYMGKSDIIRSIDCGGGRCQSDLQNIPLNQVEHVLLGEGSPIPQHRAQLRLGWRHSGMSVNLSTSYSSDTSVERSKRDPISYDYVTAVDTTKAAMPVNLVMYYDFDEAGTDDGWLKGTKVSLSIPNIFMDEAEITSTPVFENDPGGYYSPIYTRPRGRTFTLSLTKKFE